MDRGWILLGKGRGQGPTVSGRSFRIYKADEIANISLHSIVIMPRPFAELITVIERVRGIVVESGGLTAHLAVIALEMGIPYLTVGGSIIPEFPQGTLLHLDPQAGLLFSQKIGDADGS